MATAVTTGGTLSTTGLTSFPFTVNNDNTATTNPGANQFYADIGTINNLILDDKANLWPSQQVTGTPTVPVGQSVAGQLSGGILPNGTLWVPNRGYLKIYPGDYIMVDTVSGWPILVSRTAVLCSGTKWNP